MIKLASMRAGGNQRPDSAPLGASLAALLVASVLQTAPAGAIVYVMPTDESMVDRSLIIVFGEVLSAQPGPAGAPPTTDYLFAVEEVLKGFVAGSGIMVRQPGGVGVDGVAMRIGGLPMLAEGDRVLLFLRAETNGAHAIVEYALGMFWEIDVGGRSLLVREASLEGAAPLAEAATAAVRPTRSLPRNADRFRRWIADRTTGMERPGDYFEDDVPGRPAAVVQPYRLLRTRQNSCWPDVPIRWQEFDRSERLGFVVDAGGQKGVPGGGLSQLRRGMQVWNNDSRSRTNLIVQRTTNAVSPARVADGVNSIVYEDPFNEIEGSFHPEEGGTLAVGGVFYLPCAGRHAIPGGTAAAVQAVEGYVITQDGLGDYLRFGAVANPANYFERLMAHELGHAIGISHPCEPDEPDCDDSHQHWGALMWPTMNRNDTSRARLHTDDRAAVRRLYPIPERPEGDPPGDPPGNPPGDPGESPCGGDTCLLQGERFRVKARYSRAGAPSQSAGAIEAALADSAGLFSAGSDSPELLVRIVNQCGTTGYWEVYAGVASDADFSVAVRHVETNELKWFRTRDRQSIADTEAFACTRSDDRASAADPGGGTGGAACSGVTCLLQEDRFRVKSWYAHDGGSSQAADAISVDLGESAGLFTFDSGNPELLVRIADTCSASGYWTVYAGTASDADFRVAIRDTETNELKWFQSRGGQSVADAEAFPCTGSDNGTPPGDPGDSPCSGDTCLLQGERFRVKARYSKAGAPGQSARATEAALADSVGLFSAGSDSPELLVRIVNQCRTTGYWGVYAGVASDADFSVAVRHVETNELRWFRVRDGRSVGDTEAFACTDGDAEASTRGIGGDPDNATCTGATCLLQDDIFRVKSWYAREGGSSRAADAVSVDLGASAGLFSFGGDDPELLVRIADTCSASGYWTVYAGAASDADFRVAIRDTDTNELKWFSSPDGQSVAEAEAFACGDREPRAPDLVVSSASVSDTSVTAGATLTLSATVRNQGDGRSRSTTLRYYRSSDSTISTSDDHVGTDAVGTLSASGSSEESIGLTATSTLGTYYYGACVDPVPRESNTDNNCSTGVRVTVGSGVTEYRYDDGNTTTASSLRTSAGDVHEQEFAQRFRLTRSGTVNHVTVCVGRRENVGNSSRLPFKLTFYRDSAGRPGSAIGEFTGTLTSPPAGRGQCYRLSGAITAQELGRGNTWLGLSWLTSTGMSMMVDDRATGATKLSVRARVNMNSAWTVWQDHPTPSVKVFLIRLGVNDGGSTTAAFQNRTFRSAAPSWTTRSQP